MKTKIAVIAVLLLTAVWFASCTEFPDYPQNTDLISSDDTAASAEETADPFSAVRTSGEEWIDYGLAAYESGKPIEDLTDFFSDSANLTYLTLYDHFFTYDKEKSVPAAEAFFAFVADEYGVEAVLDIEKRSEYKNAYLKSLGLGEIYANPPIVESFLASMDFSSNTDYKYIISFDNVRYYFKDFDVGSPQQYHGFLYYSTVGLRKLTEYLEQNELSEGLDTARDFNFYIMFDGSTYSKTVNASGDMYIHDSYSTLHEAMHAMGVKIGPDIWLSEGICNYFGKALGFNDQIAASSIQMLTMIGMGYFDEQAESGDKTAILNKAVYTNFTAWGGKIDSIVTFDFRLYYDASAKAELDSGIYATLGEGYRIVNNKECYSVGKELSYDQATSLVMYLVDTYEIENVLAAYRSGNIESSLGKGYKELKADWLAYLNSTYN